MKIVSLCILSILFISSQAWAQTIPENVTYKSRGSGFSSNEIKIHDHGIWTRGILIPVGASPETTAKAELLRGYLERMGGPIAVLTSSTGVGIRVGTYVELLPTSPGYEDILTANTQDYTLVSRENGLLIGGKDQESLEMGIWRFLELLGYRQYFPTSTWEVLPTAGRKISVNLRVLETRIFDSENMIASSFDLVETTAIVSEWKRKNRIGYEGGVDDHQMWMTFIGANSTVFDSNPQYSSSAGWKLCVMEPEVQRLFVDYMKAEVVSKPTKLTHSVSAADGSLGWYEACENGYPVKDGGTGENSMTPSDRQVFIANLVQKAFRTETDPRFVGKRVAMLAYGDTSPAPTIHVDKDVVITVTTAFIKGGLTALQVAENYRSMGSPRQLIGFYAYLGTQIWGHGNPTSAKITNQSTWVPLFNETMSVTAPSPVKNISGESGAAWGAYGLGFYTFARLFSPPNSAKSASASLIAEIKADFLSRAFGPAALPVGQFLDMITASDGSQRLLSTDLLHKMYDYLSQARALINPLVDVTINNRINDLILYTRSQELWRLSLVASADANAKFDAFNTLAQYVYRIRSTMMFDYYNFFFDPTFASLEQQMIDLYPFDKFDPFAIINNSGWNATPFKDTEILAFLTQGLASNSLFPFKVIFYSTEDLDITTAFDADTRGRAGPDQDAFLPVAGNHDWILKTKAGQTTFTLSAKAGSGTTHIPDSDGPAVIELYQTDLSSGMESLVGSFEIIADNLSVAVQTFDVVPESTYRLHVVDPRVLVQLKWDKTQYKIVNTPLEGDYHLRANTSYFYVPKSATSIGVYLGQDLSAIYAPDNNTEPVYKSTSSVGEFVSIPITNDANKGKIWKIYCRASSNPLQGCYLYNVPPQLSRSPQELLIQKNLIISDKL